MRLRQLEKVVSLDLCLLIGGELGQQAIGVSKCLERMEGWK
jgi:hypothetical protein